MKIVTYGNPSASAVLIQPVGDHDLSAWKSPAVFGKGGFGDGAEDMLQCILRQVRIAAKHTMPGIFLAGLFYSVGSVSDGHFCRCCGGITFHLVSRFPAIYEGA